MAATLAAPSTSPFKHLFHLCLSHTNAPPLFIIPNGFTPAQEAGDNSKNDKNRDDYKEGTNGAGVGSGPFGVAIRLAFAAVGSIRWFLMAVAVVVGKDITNCCY